MIRFIFFSLFLFPTSSLVHAQQYDYYQCACGYDPCICSTDYDQSSCAPDDSQSVSIYEQTQSVSIYEKTQSTPTNEESPARSRDDYDQCTFSNGFFQYSIGNPQKSAVVYTMSCHPSRQDSRYLVSKLYPVLAKYIKRYPHALSIVIIDRPRRNFETEKAIQFSTWIWSQPHPREYFIRCFFCSDQSFEDLFSDIKVDPYMREKVEDFYADLNAQEQSPGTWIRDPVKVIHDINDQLERAGHPLIDPNEIQL